MNDVLWGRLQDRRRAIWNSILALAMVGGALVALVIALSGTDHRSLLIGGFAVAAAAGLSASSVGIYGGVLVPGLLLLGVDPRLTAPMSLLLQVLVVPIGASGHYAFGHVRPEITLPLALGGVLGSILGAAAASFVSGRAASAVISALIILVGVLVLATLTASGPSAHTGETQVTPRRIGGIGFLAGLASGISGAGWGPIGVKLLILSGVEPRYAIGSSLVGRIAMAVAGVIAYSVTAFGRGIVGLDVQLFVALLGGSILAIAPGTYLVSRLPRRPAAAFVAVLSIGLALPTLLGGLK